MAGHIRLSVSSTLPAGKDISSAAAGRPDIRTIAGVLCADIGPNPKNQASTGSHHIFGRRVLQGHQKSKTHSIRQYILPGYAPPSS